MQKRVKAKKPRARMDIRDVARYWRRLIEINRSRLPEPADPSLIFPGDELLLPHLPQA